MSVIEPTRSNESASRSVEALAALNSVSFIGEHIQSALIVLRCLPREEQFDHAAQAEAIRDYVVATGIVSPIAAPALHARVVALNKWTAKRGLRHDGDAVAVMDAAAMCQLIDGSEGIGFDAERFAGAVALVADMPW